MTPRARGAVAVAVVAVQAVLLVAVFAWPAGGDWPVPGWLRTLAGAVQALGWAVLLVAFVNLGRSLTPLPTPAGGSTLKTGGLYRFVRHPIYTGVLAIVFGSVAASGSVVKLALGGALLGLFTAKASWEEGLLRERYPDYAAYAARTPRFLPLRLRR